MDIARSSKNASKFTFINQSDQSPETKSENIHKVRSHARAYAAKEFKQKHKTVSRQKRGQELDGSLSSNDSHSRLIQQVVNHAGGFAINDSWEVQSSGPATTPTSDDTGTTQTSLTPHLWRNLPPLTGGSKLQHRDLRARAKSPMPRAIAPPYHILPSPLEVMGAGRVDPFLSFPAGNSDPDLHELVDIELSYVLPGMCPDDYPHRGSQINAVSQAWMSRCLENTFLFNILLWIACVQRDFVRGTKTYGTSVQALSYKVAGIRQLTEALSCKEKALTDEVILTCLGLAANEIVNVTEEKMKPFRSQLKHAGHLNVYGGTHIIPEHLQTIIRLVGLRGGIEKLALPGLAESIVLAEICGVINSSFRLRPVFPPSRLHEPYIAALNEWSESLVKCTQTPARSFRNLPKCGITDAMLDVLDSMKAATIAIDYYLEGKPAGLTLGQIVKARTGVQKHLILLPTAKVLNSNRPELQVPNIYEVCRLTALIFSVGVTFPIPNTYNVLQFLVREIKLEIELMNIESFDNQMLEVLLWVLVLGGIAALGKPERNWFVLQIALVGVDTLKLDWDRMIGIMESFLWLDSPCFSGGRQLWEEVMRCVQITA